MSDATLVDEVAQRVAEVRHRIAATGRSPGEVRVVAVTKGFGAPVVEAAVAAGCHDLGENYAQEMVAKAGGAPAEVRWHFLGALQRNKAASLAPVVDLWHGIDRAGAIDALAARRPGAAVLVEVNVAADPAKHGATPDLAPALVERARLAGLQVQGLMTVAPAGDREGAVRCFSALAALAARLQLPELSMGMSDDYDLAVAEGATIVRLGRALFGARPPRTSAGTRPASYADHGGA